METKEQLTKQFIMVGMGNVDISTDEKPIIGTQALSPCIGFVLHSKEKEKAIVGHVSCNQLMENEKAENLRFQISTLLEQGGLQNVPLDLKIIEGAYPSAYSVYSHELNILDIFGKSKYSLLEVLEEVVKKSDFSNIRSTTFYQEQTSTNDIHIVDVYDDFGHGDRSKQFAFDATSGEFVTDKVCFGLDYLRINNLNTK